MKAKDKHRELSKGGTNIKREYDRNRYCNMPEENKQKREVFQKKYREAN